MTAVAHLMLIFSMLLVVDGATKTKSKSIVSTLTTPTVETTSALYTTEGNETEFSCNSSDVTCSDYVTVESTTISDFLNISTTNQTPVVTMSPKLQNELYDMSGTSACFCNLQVYIIIFNSFFDVFLLLIW